MNRTLPTMTLVTTCCILMACGGRRQATDLPVTPTPTVTGGGQTANTPASPLATATGSPRSTEPQPLTIDLEGNPNLQVRIDSFSVPAASRAEFEAKMHQNAAFLATLPGFKGHVVFENTSGPTTFNIVTFAAWESPETIKSAGEKVQAEYQRIGFDMQGTIARWGVTASLGNYRAPMALQ